MEAKTSKRYSSPESSDPEFAVSVTFMSVFDGTLAAHAYTLVEQGMDPPVETLQTSSPTVYGYVMNSDLYTSILNDEYYDPDLVPGLASATRTWVSVTPNTNQSSSSLEAVIRLLRELLVGTTEDLYFMLDSGLLLLVRLNGQIHIHDGTAGQYQTAFWDPPNNFMTVLNLTTSQSNFEVIV